MQRIHARTLTHSFSEIDDERATRFRTGRLFCANNILPSTTERAITLGNDISVRIDMVNYVYGNTAENI